MTINIPTRNLFQCLANQAEDLTQHPLIHPHKRLQIKADDLHTDIYRMFIPIIFRATEQIRETYAIPNAPEEFEE